MRFYSKYANYIVKLDGGDNARFQQGEFRTEDPNVIAQLQKGPSFGVDYFEDKGDAASQNVGSGNDDDLDNKTKDQLLEIAAQKGVEASGNWTKAQIIAAIASAQ